jgi:abequosyltransferase
MTDPIKLSICIPTYNFGAFIAQTLDSIIPQLLPGVELVILDGGSSDNTPKVVRAFLDRGLPISYLRQEVRGGIDRDMARTVELARGEYCWLFSSDDIMKPGAIGIVLEEIQSGHDIYICGLTLCDFDMNVISEHPVSRAGRGEVFDLKRDADRRRYFRLAETTTALFSFMGSLIFKRERWHQHELERGYINSLWAHVVRILRMIPNGLKVKYLGESLLNKRSGNDSFMERGLVHRYAMAIDGYHRIANDIFGARSLEARHIRRVLVNEFPPRIFFFLKEDSLKAGRGTEIPEIDRLVHKAYCDATARSLAYLLDYRFSLTPICQRAMAVAKGIARNIF